MNSHTIRQTILLLEDKINEGATRIHTLEGERDSLITSLVVTTSKLNFMKHERKKNQKLLREYLDLAEHQVFQTANQGGAPKNIYATQKAYAPEAAREFDQKSSG